MNNAEQMIVGSVHPFERAGLGKAPFRCVGTYEKKFVAAPGCPPQPGTSCDYCGQGIMYVCAIMSADGKSFKVGCDCVAKLQRKDNTPEDRRLITTAQAFAKKRAAELRKANEARKLDELADLMNNPEIVAKLQAATRVRTDWKGNEITEPLYNWAVWMVANAGTRGKLQVLKTIREL